jgi:putative flippase GtrA
VRRPLQKRFGRFSAVGLMGAAIQLLLLYFATKEFGLPSVAAMPVAAEIALLHNFIWHERFTWRDRGVSTDWSENATRRGGESGIRVSARSRAVHGGPRATSPGEIAARLWRFHIASGLISLGGNTVAMYFLVQRLQVPAMPAAIAAMILCSVVNFLATDRWVYV